MEENGDITVVIVEGNPFLRSGIRQALESQPGMQVVADFDHGAARCRNDRFGGWAKHPGLLRPDGQCVLRIVGEPAHGVAGRGGTGARHVMPVGPTIVGVLVPDDGGIIRVGPGEGHRPVPSPAVAVSPVGLDGGGTIFAAMDIVTDWPSVRTKETPPTGTAVHSRGGRLPGPRKNRGPNRPR